MKELIKEELIKVNGGGWFCTDWGQYWDWIVSHMDDDSAPMTRQEGLINGGNGASR